MLLCQFISQWWPHHLLEHSIPHPQPSHKPSVSPGTQPNSPVSQANLLTLFHLARGEPAINLCAGPILRFTGLTPDLQKWRGSVLIAVVDADSNYSQLQNQRAPMLFYRITESGNTASPGTQLATGSVDSQLLISEFGVSLFRFPLDLFVHPTSEVLVEYNVNNFAGSGQFYIPAQTQTMNMVFHSCNGFSLGADPDEYKSDLWQDVLRHHRNNQNKHFHVMFGGGDQIYNDAVKEKCPPISRWAKEKSPAKKLGFAFTENDARQTEQFYMNHYIAWFGQGWWEGPHGRCLRPGFPEAMANIPSINIYDDHDIIDGFGSYNDETMKSAVFSGIGRVAHKYYMLFQHHTHPDELPEHEPSWISNPRPGPFMNQRSRSVYARVGKGAAFLGLDCRTERTLEHIVYPDTYDLVFARLRAELNADPSIRHLLVMLGVPIAYPRLVWLESVLKSSALTPLKMLAKHKIAMSSLVNNFDGSVEILDDLNDHWCAKVHKKERNKFITELQHLADETSVRITILAGDVHLGAVGRFFSNPHTTNVGAWPEADHRLMINVISSAITNAPPGSSMADFLNTRNKIHHMDIHTDEDMLKIFKNDTNGSPRNNQTLLPRRNWCSIMEIGHRSNQYTPNLGLPQSSNVGKTVDYGAGNVGAPACTDPAQVEGPIHPEHTNTEKEYTKYPDKRGALSIVLHVEKAQENLNAETRGYELVAPLLIKEKKVRAGGGGVFHGHGHGHGGHGGYGAAAAPGAGYVAEANQTDYRAGHVTGSVQANYEVGAAANQTGYAAGAQQANYVTGPGNVAGSGHGSGASHVNYETMVEAGKDTNPNEAGQVGGAQQYQQQHYQQPQGQQQQQQWNQQQQQPPQGSNQYHQNPNYY